MSVSTYADGYGRWHALVPDTPRGLVEAANAIAEQIAQRDDVAIAEALAYVHENIVSLPNDAVSYGGYIQFAEYAIERD